MIGVEEIITAKLYCPHFADCPYYKLANLPPQRDSFEREVKVDDGVVIQLIVDEKSAFGETYVCKARQAVEENGCVRKCAFIELLNNSRGKQ